MDNDDVDNVKVAVRIRPLLPHERGDHCIQCLHDTVVRIGVGPRFTFDHVFSKTSQEHLFQETVLPLLDRCIEGYNGTILAYGQTGSGKTHTIVGDLESEEQAGILPRAFQALFDQIDDKNTTVRLSFLELYGEIIRDLLGSSTSQQKLQIRDFGNDEPIIVGATQTSIESAAQATRLLQQGMLKRVTGSTAMNATSSRSHAILTLHIEQNIVHENHTQTKRSKFNFVDLAGSERIKRTQAEGQRLKEGIDINKGLLVLGNVISALGDPVKKGRTFVPYRDSKLTRLLKGSLGGNHKTLMIVCVSPSSENMEESLNCLRYANRAKNIQNNAVVNVDPTSQLVGELTEKIQKLAQDLLCFHHGQGTATLHYTLEMLQDIVQDKENESPRKKSSTNNMATELARAREDLRETQKNHDQAEEELFATKAEKEMYRLQLSVVQDGGNLDQAFLDKAKAYEEEITRLRDALKRAEKQAATMEFSVDDYRRALDEDRQRIEALQSEMSAESQFEEEQRDKEEETVTLTQKYLRAAGHEDSENPPDEDESGLNSSFARERENLKADLFDLTKSIEAKEDLIDQLKLSQEKYANMRQFYEEKLNEMQRVLDEKEAEREELVKELEESKHDDSALRSLKARLDEKEQHIANLRKKQRELSELTKVSSKNDIEIDRLQNDVFTMKKRKVELQKQLGQERKDHAKEIKRLQKEAMQKDRELNKQKSISNKFEISAQKANQVAKARLEELGHLRSKYKESEKRIRMLSVKRGVMEKAGLDPVLVGKRIKSKKKDVGKAKAEEDAIESLQTYFDKKVVDFARKETLVDKLAEEWEEHFQLSQEYEDISKQMDPDDEYLCALRMQIDFKEDRIRQYAKKISSEDQKSLPKDSTKTDSSDFFSGTEIETICKELETEATSNTIAKVLFGMVVKERRRVGALARSSSKLDNRLQAAERSAKESSDALKRYMEEYQKEKTELIQSHQEHILSLMDLVRETDVGDESTTPSQKQELDYLSSERVRVLSSQVETYKAEVESAEMELIRLGEIENDIHKIRKESRSTQKNLKGAISTMYSLRALVTKHKKKLSGSLFADILQLVDDGLSFEADEKPEYSSPKLRRQTLDLDPFSDEAIANDDTEGEEIPEWANDIMKDLAIIAEGNVPPSLAEVVNEIDRTPPPDSNKAGTDKSVFDRLNDPSTFTGTQKKVAKKKAKRKSNPKAPKESVAAEERKAMAEDITQRLGRIEIPGLDDDIEGNQHFNEDEKDKRYQSVFDRLMSPSQYTGTQREKVQKSKSKAEKIQNDVADRILDDILSDDGGDIDRSIDHALHMERAEEYTRQDVFERLQKTTTQSYAVKQNGPIMDASSNETRNAHQPNSPVRPKASFDPDTRNTGREHFSHNPPERHTSSYDTSLNVFERLQKTKTEAFAKKTRKDNS